MGNIQPRHFSGLTASSAFEKYDCVKFVEDAQQKYSTTHGWGGKLDTIIKQDAAIVITGKSTGNTYIGLWVNEDNADADEDGITTCVLRPEWVCKVDSAPHSALVATIKAKETEIRSAADAQPSKRHKRGSEYADQETRKLTIAERIERIEEQLGLE